MLFFDDEIGEQKMKKKKYMNLFYDKLRNILPNQTKNPKNNIE
jgi:hypothetical protein